MPDMPKKTIGEPFPLWQFFYTSQEIRGNQSKTGIGTHSGREEEENPLPARKNTGCYRRLEKGSGRRTPHDLEDSAATKGWRRNKLITVGESRLWKAS